MATVELKHVWKRYGAVVAVQDFCLATADGEFIVLVGPSGCGKTSTMRMIAGLETLSEGEIRFDGQDVSDRLPRDRDVAMVFQNYALFPHLDVFSNIAFGMRLRKVAKAEIESRVRKVAQTLGIEPLLGRKPKELSGGQRQRVALGRAIVREPKVFLMDEPLSNLDAGLRMEMRAEIIKLQRRLGVTTFFVTHDQVEALSMGHRVVVMHDGLTQQVGTPTELYEQPGNTFVASFIGSPSMNLLEGRASGEGIALTGEDATLRVSESARRALARMASPELRLGIRPEHIALSDRPEAGGCSLPASVEMVEPLGYTVLIHARLRSDHRINILMNGHARLALGDSVYANFAPDHIYLFDGRSGAALHGISLH
ncbi:MAG TPA: sn-glycerol-3-phosphate ABC transporter ATP-binding protein UgpC [Dongiaceae bacterium]|nr:sn-glycerol-3-phosphate ABC transporter ATP-binding protein UgpC [Dongiaceae bacterium]